MRYLAAAVVILLAAMALAGCGGGGASQADVQKARQEGAAAERAKQAAKAERQKQAQLEQRIKKLEANLAAKAKAAQKKKAAAGAASGGSAATSSRTSCGGNLYAGSNTTCPFAQNVESAWYSAGGGSVVVEAFSPVTSRYYTMQCTAGVPTICRGGNNAVVYIR